MLIECTGIWQTELKAENLMTLLVKQPDALGKGQMIFFILIHKTLEL